VAVTVTGWMRLGHKKKRGRAFSIAMWPVRQHGTSPAVTRFLYCSPAVRGSASSRERVVETAVQEYRRAQMLLVSLANVVSVTAGP
jgi:hypothetical protein